ncbi:MAG: glycerate kinase [Gammaproteobacteria bacterium]|nr:MAG: glycerate kinase [Gammaproteobacteria bacterium]
MTELTARELLVMLYDIALDAVDGRYLVNKWLRQAENKKPFTHCVAIGKAAAAMLQGAADCVPTLKKSLLVCPPSKITRQLKQNKNIICVASSHPIPDERSVEAGKTLINFLTDLDRSDELLFLISGGASSLVEVPADDINLEQLQEINQYLLSSGKDIFQVNAWRQQFSKIKGGGLLNSINVPSVTQLLLSDVKDDRAEFIGSGLLVNSSMIPDSDAYLITLRSKDKRCMEKSAVSVDTHIVGNINLAKQAVYDAAKVEGLASYIHEDFLEGDACDAAKDLYTILRDARPGIHIWGGETTVCLPEKPGVGGRNLTLALAFAKYLVDNPDLHLLAAGTDGADGNSSCAGAVVSMYTALKAGKMGFDMQQEIDKANAGIVLMATDDLVQGAHSNTNVMDIVIAYKTK